MRAAGVLWLGSSRDGETEARGWLRAVAEICWDYCVLLCKARMETKNWMGIEFPVVCWWGLQKHWQSVDDIELLGQLFGCAHFIIAVMEQWLYSFLLTCQ